MLNRVRGKNFNSLLILAIIWLISAFCDRVWFSLDHSVPAWDQADYLTGSLNYQQALQNPYWFSREWWLHFWHLSSKIPPFTYIVTAIIQKIFGAGPDQATLVMLIFSAIILGSVYGLGVLLFNRQIGLWAAGLTVLLPGLYRYRVEFLLDYPVSAVVTLSLFCLTLWKLTAKNLSPLQSLIKAVIFGLSLGLALLVKQTALLFMLIPILGVIGSTIRDKYWGRLAQIILGLSASLLICYPWYRTNWLLVLTSSKRATIDSAIAEGDPALNTLDAWIYYWKILPYLTSWTLLLVPVVGLILYWHRIIRKNYPDKSSLSSLIWLAIFLIGGYFLSSLNINKDARYILPLLPVISLILAYGFSKWQGRWAKSIRWGTVSLGFLLMLFNMFPLGGSLITKILSPRVQHFPYFGQQWPHSQVIREISQTSPYLRTTLGVLPSTPEINQHNLNYYGALANFQVYGRQVGTRDQRVEQDVRSLSWFLTKTGDQGSIPPSQPTIVNRVEQGQDFQLQQTWNLPDHSILKLYHRRQPLIEVEPISKLPIPNSKLPIQLDQVIVAEKIPPGVPVPVTYKWSGSWEQLQSGIVLITWHSLDGTSEYQWWHDHGIGMGELYSNSQLNPENYYQVVEHMAMLPPANLPVGNYTIKATYFNRKTGKNYPILMLNVNVKIDPTAIVQSAPELDLITQFRTLAAKLPQGAKALESISEQTSRINQYDPIQDYLVQTELALTYRLQLEPENLDWAYALALSQVLQKDAQGAIAALKQVVALDPQNPYAYAYLAFVYLYEWRGKEAENALQPALRLNPHLPEIQALSGIAALMQGKIFPAWHFLEEFKTLTRS